MMNLAALKKSLISSHVSIEELPTHVAAYCAFVSQWQRCYLSNARQPNSGSYQDTAAMGYQNATGNGCEVTFLKGAEHLAGRTYFSGARAPRFEIDGIALLGTALGYKTSSINATQCSWLLTLLDQSIATLANDPWQLSLAHAAKATLSEQPNWSMCDPRMTVSLSAALGENCSTQDRQQAWQSTVLNIDEQSPMQIATHQGVFDVCASALARLPIHGAGLTELIELLEGIAQSMSHWTYEEKQRVKNVTIQKWEIDHEYHVQNLLWTIIRPVFPDLVDEGSLPKLGHTTPRYDLGVPSLHTVIEVKYMRKRGQSQLKKITDEVAADRSLYLREGTGYTSMVAFIWDECQQTEEYKTLQNGLESLSGIEKVIILPRPAKMMR